MAGSGIAIILLTVGLFSVFVEDGDNTISNKTGTIHNTISNKTGTIQYIDLEGGFYGIVDDDGNKYGPVNLQDEFQEDGLRVKFSFKILTNTVSTHMWGTLIELTEIQKI